MVYSRSQNWIFKSLDGGDEGILIPLNPDGPVDLHEIFQLNSTANFIWERLERPAPLEDLLRDIALEFDFPETARDDIEGCLKDLLAFGALVAIK